MIKNYLSILFLFISVSFSYGQVVINELDSDTPGIDDKEFVELKSTVPNFSLDGYVLVFFNGNAESASTGNKSYLTISLNGLTTDANGLVLIGCNAVSPVPQKIMGDNLIQNGADAVAIYQGTAANFPDGTLATTTNLIDALAYDTNDADATALMGLLGLTIQINEDENNQGVNQSIQRKPDGTYEVKAPTPGANNDGSGIIFNGIGISVPALQYTEGTSFTITFTTQTPVTSDLAFTYTLANGSFTAADFTANTNVLIPTGSTTFTANVQLVDDAIDEGDELMKIKLGNLPAGYIRLNDNIEIRILDNDFTVSPWGTPLNPTHGIVTSTAPTGYYDSLEGKSGAVLKQAVQDIIANPAVVRAHNYGDITNILKVADQNPLNSNEVWLMYKEVSRSKFLFQDTGSGTGRWNREHIYPQSRGGFADGTSDTPDGINVWEPTSASMLNHGHADAHHLRAEDGPENSSRNNKDYGLTDYNGFSGNAGSWKGDVARAVFYMAIRYNGLDVVNGNPPDTTVGQLGDLATLLQWNVNDPSDDFEMNRNNYIYTWQQNRNPFIDYPYLADYIWGSRAGQAFSLSTPDFSELKVAIYPNPAKNYITVAGITSSATLQLFSISGQQLLTADFSGTSTIQLNLAPGMYLAKIISENRTAVRKIIIQ
ncbi:putative secreted protein (Por secretion system target) [Flavobacterium endophyticum]|uniref:Putative secreted protein (Por secretion system target) n=1 Tax=Flavobacterium endophyticum TaxID=1540163 RepID=A0A495LXB7_9FLAO|nr:endonuclease [Flavobacterium endophyticum]RKS17872.1 putative secreted protein (Por secretion system target) [Flavobacterium endophyticum]